MSIKQEVAKVVQELYDTHGEVKASALVDAARPEDSPAHPAFEWRDDVAAEEFRLIQSRSLIKVVQIQHEKRPVRLIHVTSQNIESREGYYKPAAEVVKCPSEYDRAMNAAMSQLSAARKSVDDLLAAASALEDGEIRSGMIAQVAEGLALMKVALSRAVH